MNKSGLYKGCLEPLILKLLQDNRRMYGYEITRHVRELSQGHLRITEGALYPLLHRLESEGIIQSEIEYTGNRGRKYYSLTPEGKKQKTQALADMQDFLATLSRLFNPTPQPKIS